MAINYPTWGSRQKVSAAELNSYVRDNNKILVNPPYMRATGISTITDVTSETILKWDTWETIGGFSTKDMQDFVSPADGVYWVTCTATMHTPSTMTGYNTAGLSLISGWAYNGVDDQTGSVKFIKGMVGSKINKGYHSVSTSGLMFLKKGYSIWASVQGVGGAWRKADTGNPATSLSHLTAILLYPDARQL
ncbi:hypothetical protein [Streptomyces noursei]|uniref:hypothetical protein n=1 Tax=Streptomyces noursei TaxID=1971 RepID=UPI0016789DE1|nr:hypothetical protein [Streptomyces noursei]MCZ1019394.1 hypothetical protein [Streptomyces noursei]GGX08097.1 hypothetical protein GCM10010341_32180 [Streptomyces noursei]